MLSITSFKQCVNNKDTRTHQYFSANNNSNNININNNNNNNNNFVGYSPGILNSNLSGDIATHY